MRYQHTQHAPLGYILLAIGLIMVLATLWIPEVEGKWVMGVSAAIMLLVAGMFQTLSTSDEGEHLLFKFGPLPLFQRKVPFQDITAIEAGKTNWLDGWGVHASLKGGWVWNLWGFDCLVLHLSQGRTLRIGTDDVAGLQTYLQEKLAKSANS